MLTTCLKTLYWELYRASLSSMHKVTKRVLDQNFLTYLFVCRACVARESIKAMLHDTTDCQEHYTATKYHLERQILVKNKIEK